MKTMLLFGCGYTATRLAQKLIQQGWTVIGTTRDETKRRSLEALGIDAHIFASNDPLRRDVIHQASHILTSIIPDEDGDPVLRAHQQVLKSAPHVEWMGYLGTTAVYGNHDGGWVDETTPTSPSSARGKRREAAENAWTQTGLTAHIFRLAGIYGPGRNLIETLRQGHGRRIVKKGQFFSRIHVDDIVNVLMASIARPAKSSPAIYNVCDAEPAPSDEVTCFAAELLGIDPPEAQPFETADLTPMARSFYADNRRVSNKKIKDELGVKLLYPTYREGLRALANSPVETSP